MNRTIRFATAALALSLPLSLAACTSISNPDPESAPHPGGATAEEVVKSYFDAIEAGDTAALAALAVEEVSADSIQVPTAAATFASVSGAPEANPRPIDRKFTQVEVKYEIDGTEYVWSTQLRYTDSDTGWQFVDPFFSVGDSTDDPYGAPDETAATDASEVFVPGVHSVEAATASDYLTAPEEGVEVVLAFPADDYDRENQERIEAAMAETKFTLSDSGKEAVTSEVDAFKEKCKNWCTESYGSSFDQHDPERKYDAGVLRYQPDAKMPDKFTLIDQHNKDWQTWYEEHTYGDESRHFVLVEPLTVEYTQYDCEYEDGDTTCRYATDDPEKYVLDKDVAFIYELTEEEIRLVDIRNNE